MATACIDHFVNLPVRTAGLTADTAKKITTEYSYKHSREEFIALAAEAGFHFERLWTDEERLFGVFLFSAA